MLNSLPKNRGNIKPIKKEKTLSQKIWLPIVIAIVDLLIIIILVTLFKSGIAIVIVVVLGHFVFILYLTKTLEREKISKEREIKARIKVEKKLHHEKKKVVVEKQKRIAAETKLNKQKKQIKQPKIVTKTTNINELKSYIRQTLKQRFPIKEIREGLLTAGWSKDQVDRALGEVLK